MNAFAGDRVIIYMPLIPEALMAMLATVRLGAIHSVVFGGKLSRLKLQLTQKKKTKSLATTATKRNRNVICVLYSAKGNTQKKVKPKVIDIF